MGLLAYLIWDVPEWFKIHSGRHGKWPTSRLAPARIIYQGDWYRITRKMHQDLPRPYAALALQIVLQYSRER